MFATDNPLSRIIYENWCFSEVSGRYVIWIQNIFVWIRWACLAWTKHWLCIVCTVKHRGGNVITRGCISVKRVGEMNIDVNVNGSLSIQILKENISVSRKEEFSNKAIITNTPQKSHFLLRVRQLSTDFCLNLMINWICHLSIVHHFVKIQIYYWMDWHAIL